MKILRIITFGAFFLIVLFTKGTITNREVLMAVLYCFFLNNILEGK